MGDAGSATKSGVGRLSEPAGCGQEAFSGRDRYSASAARADDLQAAHAEDRQPEETEQYGGFRRPVAEDVALIGERAAGRADEEPEDDQADGRDAVGARVRLGQEVGEEFRVSSRGAAEALQLYGATASTPGVSRGDRNTAAPLPMSRSGIVQDGTTANRAAISTRAPTTIVGRRVDGINHARMGVLSAGGPGAGRRDRAYRRDVWPQTVGQGTPSRAGGGPDRGLGLCALASGPGV